MVYCVLDITALTQHSYRVDAVQGRIGREWSNIGRLRLESPPPHIPYLCTFNHLPLPPRFKGVPRLPLYVYGLSPLVIQVILHIHQLMLSTG
jgi:hypothetical protein